MNAPGAGPGYVLLAVLLLRCVGAAWAAPLADPTRPPPGLGADRSAGAPAAPALRVTTLFLQGPRSFAIVDGITVRVGDRLDDGRGGARVLAIDARGLWLSGRAQENAGPPRVFLSPPRGAGPGVSSASGGPFTPPAGTRLLPLIPALGPAAVRPAAPEKPR